MEFKISLTHRKYTTNSFSRFSCMKNGEKRTHRSANEKIKNEKEKKNVRSGIRTHAYKCRLRPERSALDRSAILTSDYHLSFYTNLNTLPDKRLNIVNFL